MTEPESEPVRAVAPHPAELAGRQRYGEAVVREVLRARFLAEEVLDSPVVALSADGVSAGFGEVPTPDAAPAARGLDDAPSSADAPPKFPEEG